MGETIFSKIIRKEIPAQIVYEDDRAIAFRDINPCAPSHVLIVPKREVVSVNEAAPDNEADLGHLFVAARKVAELEGLTGKGYRLVINTGPAAGQVVMHFHLHLVGGTEMGWPPF